MFWYIFYIPILENVKELKSVYTEYKILMNTVSKTQPQIHYILGDMIPPSQGSILFQNSSLNRTPRENFYSLGHIGPNGIHKDFPEIKRTLISMVRISEPEDELVTRGMPYNFTVLNSPITGHLGKMIINPNW